MATFVLVHGAFSAGSVWQRVTPILEAEGHDTHALTLPGLGDRAALATPELGLNDHVRDVARLLEEQDLRDVTLVGHSYGGMVITGVAGLMPERLAQLVYFDALVPRDGEAAKDVVPKVISRYRRRARARGNGWLVPAPIVKPNPITRAMSGFRTDADFALANSLLADQPLKTFEEPIRLADPNAPRSLPRTFIYCRNRGLGAVINLGMRHLVERRLRPPAEHGWRIRDLPTGHYAMLTLPGDTAGLLLELAPST